MMAGGWCDGRRIVLEDTLGSAKVLAARIV